MIINAPPQRSKLRMVSFSEENIKELMG